jgi:hypothetical protein
MGDFYYCLTHHEVEQGTICRADNRLGPYATAEEARGWKQRHEGREETWEEEDKRWHGDDEDG